MTKQYDLAVFIGRFQPFHNGHLAVVKQALEVANRVLILVGSANRARDTRNPFTYPERVELIVRSLKPLMDDEPFRWLTSHVEIKALPDSTDVEWVQDVQHAVKRTMGPILAPRVCLIGHERDFTSAYLRWFPMWPYVPVKDPTEINATAIREVVFAEICGHEGQYLEQAVNVQPVAQDVASWLCGFRGHPECSRLNRERKLELAYKEKWGDREPHVTADAVVIKSGHVLLIERGPDALGAGMLALPGGFKERGETLFQSACRELREETSLQLDNTALAQFLRGSDVFDDPNRSRRGEIITHAFYFNLGDGPLPAVRGQDDAAKALWVPLSDVRVDTLFEDHAFIIKRALTKL